MHGISQTILPTVVALVEQRATIEDDRHGRDKLCAHLRQFEVNRTQQIDLIC